VAGAAGQAETVVMIGHAVGLLEATKPYWLPSPVLQPHDAVAALSAVLTVLSAAGGLWVNSLSHALMHQCTNPPAGLRDMGCLQAAAAKHLTTQQASVAGPFLTLHLQPTLVSLRLP
jgi:hypothetical protein